MKLLKKYGKSAKYFGGAVVLVVAVWGFLGYQLIAGTPVFSKFDNGEVSFDYPRWATGSGYVVKTENPLRGAGIEVAKKPNANLPLLSWLGETSQAVTKDRKLVSKDESKADQAIYVTEFKNPRGKEFTMTTKLVSAGSNVYILSAYTLKKKAKGNEKVLKRFLDSVKVKKQPLFAKADASGAIVKNLDGKLLAFSKNGEELVLIYTKDMKAFDKKGEIKESDGKFPDFTGMSFIAQGQFEKDSKIVFNVSKIMVYDE